MKEQIKMVKSLASEIGETLTDAAALKCVKQILDNTADYYICGDRNESTRTDDFYYDAKDFFSN